MKTCACMDDPGMPGDRVPPRRAVAHRLTAAMLLCLAVQPATAQQPVQDDDTTTLEAIRVTAPPQTMEDIYRSKPVERTAPTVFDKDWREPVNLKKIGDEGGVVPILVRFASKQITKGARKIPGWKPPVEAAVARPPPLDEAQVQRAMQLQASSEGDD